MAYNDLHRILCMCTSWTTLRSSGDQSVHVTCIPTKTSFLRGKISPQLDGIRYFRLLAPTELMCLWPLYTTENEGYC